jgi:hypothetical protein
MGYDEGQRQADTNSNLSYATLGQTIHLSEPQFHHQ